MKHLSNHKCPVKRGCYNLKINQKELSILLGVSEGTVNRWASKKIIIPLPMKNAIFQLETNQLLKMQLERYDTFFSLMTDITRERLLK